MRPNHTLSDIWACCRWICIHTQQTFAVKKLSKHLLRRYLFLYENERNALQRASAHHVPRVVKLHEALEGPTGDTYLVLEYVPLLLLPDSRTSSRTNRLQKLVCRMCRFVHGRTLENFTYTRQGRERMTLGITAQLIHVCQLLSTVLCYPTFAYDCCCQSPTVTVVMQSLWDLHTCAQVAHLDISSSNVMILDGPDRQLKLIDFGFAQQFSTGDCCAL